MQLIPTVLENCFGALLKVLVSKNTNSILSNLLDCQVSWLAQQAKTSWLSVGEDDLKFLFTKVKRRKNSNFIRNFVSPNGILSTHSSIAMEGISYFEELFNSSNLL